MKLTEYPLRDQSIQKTQIYAVRGVRICCMTVIDQRGEPSANLTLALD